MFLSLPHCFLDIFATEKRVDHRCEYGLEIPANFHFHALEKAIKLTKKENDRVEENLNETVKHCLK